MTNEIQQEQYRVVDELLKRQDEALYQLDMLCQKVEQAIKDVSLSRETNDLPTNDSIDSIDTAAALT